MNYRTDWFVLCILLVHMSRMERVVLHRRIRGNEANPNPEYSFYEALDPMTDNWTTILGPYPKMEYSNCSSVVQSAFHCLKDDRCNFFHFDQTKAMCSTYELAGLILHDNGLLQFSFTIPFIFPMRTIVES